MFFIDNRPPLQLLVHLAGDVGRGGTAVAVGQGDSHSVGTRRGEVGLREGARRGRQAAIAAAPSVLQCACARSLGGQIQRAVIADICLAANVHRRFVRHGQFDILRGGVAAGVLHGDGHRGVRGLREG